MTSPTQNYRFNHTMLRIRDPKASLHFYQTVLGMTVIRQRDFEEAAFSLYFLSFPGTDSEEGVLELTHNHGTENDLDFAGYHDGNSDPSGFGHICISVPDMDEACARFDAMGVRFIKRPDEGNMKGLAFIADPDGYWVEILSTDRISAMLRQ